MFGIHILGRGRNDIQNHRLAFRNERTPTAWQFGE